MKKGKFYKHLFYALVLTVILLWVSLKALDIYTRHGKVYVVPDFTGKTVAQIEQEGYDKYFDIQVIDSVYDQKRPKGSIIMQNPEPDSKVKQGRHLYLTVVAALPEKVVMPNLKNLSLRQALVTLETSGLREGRLKYIDYFARNAVIDQILNGEPVEAGTELYRGTEIDLVVGKGDIKVYVPLPFLVGKTPEEVRHDLHYASLNVGNEVYMDGDKKNVKVYKTYPKQLSDAKLQLGDAVSIWYRSADEFDFDGYINKLLEKDSLTGVNGRISNMKKTHIKNE